MRGEGGDRERRGPIRHLMVMAFVFQKKLRWFKLGVGCGHQKNVNSLREPPKGIL